MGEVAPPTGELPFLRASDGGVSIQARVQPRTARSGIGGIREGLLLIRVNTPPVEGQANEACILLLADTLGVGKSQVRLVTGEKGRTKRFLIHGIDIETAARLLSAKL